MVYVITGTELFQYMMSWPTLSTGKFTSWGPLMDRALHYGDSPVYDLHLLMDLDNYSPLTLVYY